LKVISLENIDAAAVEYLKVHDKRWVETDFEAAAGVGITVTEGEIRNLVDTYISTNKDTILAERYKAQPVALKNLAANPFLKWADPKQRTEIITKAFENLLGPKDQRDASVKKVYPSFLPDIRKKSKPNPPRQQWRNKQKQPKESSQTCSQKDGSATSINQAETRKPPPNSWKPISAQQEEKLSLASPPNQTDTFISATRKPSLSISDMPVIITEYAISVSTIPILRPRRNNISQV
jgi:hypothetical protein